MRQHLLPLAAFWAFFLQLSRWALFMPPQFAGLGRGAQGMEFAIQPDALVGWARVPAA